MTFDLDEEDVELLQQFFSRADAKAEAAQAKQQEARKLQSEAAELAQESEKAKQRAAGMIVALTGTEHPERADFDAEAATITLNG